MTEQGNTEDTQPQSETSMKIYLAGRIHEATDWRQDLIGNACLYDNGMTKGSHPLQQVCHSGLATYKGSKPFPISVYANHEREWSWPMPDIVRRDIFRPGCHYVGPYLYNGQHGYVYAGNHSYPPSSVEVYDEEGRFLQDEIEQGRSLIRGQIHYNCRVGLDAATHIFAWIDSAKAFGTFAEIGYAYALNKTISIGLDRDLDPGLKDDLWFVLRMGGVYEAKNHVQAFYEAMAHWSTFDLTHE